MTLPVPSLRDRVYRALANFGRQGASAQQLSEATALSIEIVRAALDALKAAKQVEIVKSNLNWRARGAASASGSVTSSVHEPQTANPPKAAQEARTFSGARR